MTSKYLTGTYSSGYTPTIQINSLTIGSEGQINGAGLKLNHYVNVLNLDRIPATYAGVGNNGISATANAYIKNYGGIITGYNGVALYTVGTVINDGFIFGNSASEGVGVALEAGGTLINNNVVPNGDPIYGSAGGVVANGTATVTNAGMIVTQKGGGVELGVGDGLLTNNASGTIVSKQGEGVLALGGAATIVNTGLIDAYAGVGIDFTLSNSSQVHLVNNNKGGTIEGAGGIRFANSGTVNNSAVIDGYAQSGGGMGIYAGTTLTMTNAAGGTVEGDGAIRFRNGSIANLGAIHGSEGDGVSSAGKGAVTNGSATDTAALIDGVIAGVMLNVGVVANFGTISGDVFGDGVFIQSANVTNGSASDTRALIAGYTGLQVGLYGLNATVTNFGTISGAGSRPALAFADASDVLVVEAGCVFTGAVLGAGGTLDLDNGTGTLTGLMGGGTVTVSGSMAATAFSGFDTVEIAPVATFATSGAVSLAPGQSVVSAGSLTLGSSGATIANAGVIETQAGTVTVKGAVSGAGHAVIDGGLLDFTAAFRQNVTFSGATGTLELARSQGYTGSIADFSRSGRTALDLVDIAFTGSGEATYSGSKTGGVLTVTDGTHTAHIKFSGNYTGSTWIASSDGHGGTTIVDPTRTFAVATPHTVAFIAAMAGFGGGAGPLPTPSRDARQPESAQLTRPA